MTEQSAGSKTYLASPIVFETVGDKYIDSLQIGAILWDAETSDGDRCILRAIETGELLWQSRTNSVHTHQLELLGAGIATPKGAILDRFDGTGVLIIYPRLA